MAITATTAAATAAKGRRTRRRRRKWIKHWRKVCCLPMTSTSGDQSSGCRSVSLWHGWTWYHKIACIYCPVPDKAVDDGGEVVEVYGGEEVGPHPQRGHHRRLQARQVRRPTPPTPPSQAGRQHPRGGWVQAAARTWNRMKVSMVLKVGKKESQWWWW